MGSSRHLLSSILLVSLFLTFAEARELLVGGKPNAWKIPSSQSESLNKWAGASRFQIGDSLVWNYDSTRDSVLQVSKTDYETCNTSSPIAVHKDGNTKVKLEKSGPYYFISGAEGHCQKGQKLILVVMAARSQLMGISPAPSPVAFDGPAVAPTSSAVILKSGFVGILGVLMGLALF
ncbi:hypothetical protein DITRI_Ditri03aG0019400 [Diplodiscus trichospermus]